MGSDRLEMLRSLVSRSTADSRLRYMLAIELGKSEDYEGAAAEFLALLAADPDYVAAYYQAGQALERLGRLEDARETYRRGIEASRRAGDRHAGSELEAALAALP